MRIEDIEELKKDLDCGGFADNDDVYELIKEVEQLMDGYNKINEKINNLVDDDKDWYIVTEIQEIINKILGKIK